MFKLMLMSHALCTACTPAVQPYELLAAHHLDMDIERFLTVST